LLGGRISKQIRQTAMNAGGEKLILLSNQTINA
jgi:hypothetical protein